MAAKNLKIRPLDDRVVVEPVEAEERTAGGIVLPLSVAVGDEVIYGKYSGSDIEVDGHEVKILRESDILAKVMN